jgi:zinc finger protein
MTLTNQEPMALSAKIISLDDLKMRVIKSGTATISIPEFGATITPSPYSEGYLSNVEGVLERIEDALTFMLSSAKGKRLEKGKRMLKKIELARERTPHFTIIIKDPVGNSALVSSDPKKVRKRRLSRRELLRTRFGQYALVTRTAQQ